MNRPALRALAIVLALLAMTLRGLLPAGWMPAQGASPLAICSLDGPVAPGASHQPADHRTPCPFYVKAQLSAPAAAPALHTASEIVGPPRPAEPHAFAAVAPRLIHRTRGPPLSA